MPDSILCPICGVTSIVIVDRYYEKNINKKFTMYKCQNCSIEFWCPMKIIPEYYIRRYHKYYIISQSGNDDILPVHIKPFFDFFPLAQKYCLLDIGCGDGLFISECQKHGADTYGVDLDEKSIRVAREKRGLQQVYCGMIEDFINKINKHFDVVTLFEVLEHSDNPRKLIKCVKSLLKPDGFVVGSVPDRSRPLIWLDRYLIKGDLPPNHFTTWSSDILHNFLSSEGFTDIEIHLTGRRNLKEWALWWQDALIGGISFQLVKRFKGTSDNEMAKNITIKNISIRVNMYKSIYVILKKIKDIFIWPVFIFLGICTYLKYRENGIYLYFQARFACGEDAKNA